MTSYKGVQVVGEKLDLLVINSIFKQKQSHFEKKLCKTKKVKSLLDSGVGLAVTWRAVARVCVHVGERDHAKDRG